MIYAKYTVVLKTLLDDPIIKPKIDHALSTYPMYESKIKHELKPSFLPTREILNKKILDYYKYREIGFETVGRFLDELEIAMNEIMPYYNDLMYSADQDFNIIYNVDYTKTMNTQRDGKENTDTTSTMNVQGNSESNVDSTGSDQSSTTSTLKDNSKDVNSQTPQSELSITAANIDQVSYADNVTWKENNSNSQASTTGSTSAQSTTTNENESQSNSTLSGTNVSEQTETMIETTKGNYGQVSSQSLIERYRELIINIEQKIIRDKRIQELFMLVY